MEGRMKYPGTVEIICLMQGGFVIVVEEYFLRADYYYAANAEELLEFLKGLYG